MTSDNVTRSNDPTQHEEEVARQEREHRGLPSGELLAGDTGEVGTTPYEAEVEAERRGTSAGEVADEAARDESEPLDSAYRPRSG
jgi:hypothetical protein